MHEFNQRAVGGQDSGATLCRVATDESRAGVPLTNLDQPLFDGADATKRDLVDYLEGVSDLLLPELRDRPLSVIRVHRGHEAFMQKNVPKHAPDFIPRVTFWAETSKRDVSYALCNDLPTLMWFANQRAVEYHPALLLATSAEDVAVTHLVLDLDPPEDRGFAAAVTGARLVREALDASGLVGAVKTSGAKGVHVFVPVDRSTSIEDAAAATRAIAARAASLDPDAATTEFLKEDRGGRVFVDATRVGAATVVAAWSPRVRPGAPVSFPVGWDDLDDVSPGDFTIRNALDQLDSAGPWLADLTRDQVLPEDLVAEGREIPPGRVSAMHEGRRRARTRRSGDDGT